MGGTKSCLPQNSLKLILRYFYAVNALFFNIIRNGSQALGRMLALFFVPNNNFRPIGVKPVIFHFLSIKIQVAKIKISSKRHIKHFTRHSPNYHEALSLIFCAKNQRFFLKKSFMRRLHSSASTLAVTWVWGCKTGRGSLE